MGKMRLIGINVLVLLAALFVGRAMSQQAKPGAGGGGADGSGADGSGMGGGNMGDMQAAMKKYIATIKPSEHHKKLEPFIGKWNVTIRMWMMGPSGPATETRGKSEVKWVLGERFVQEDLDAEMMLPDATMQVKPRKYNGIGLIGYDNYRHMYVGSWANSLSTALLTYNGACDPGGKTFTFYGEMDEPMLDVVGRTVKYVMKIETDDKHLLDVYDLHAGEGYKVVEIDYERQK